MVLRIAVAVALCALLSACTTTEKAPTAPATTFAAHAYDPPRAFGPPRRLGAADSGVGAIGQVASALPATLIGPAAIWLDSDGVHRMDLATGAVRWTVPAPGTSITGQPLPTPVYRAGTLYVALPTTSALRLLALDPATGTTRWETTITVPPKQVLAAARLVGVTADTAVVVTDVSTDGIVSTTTHAIDVTSHRIRWSLPLFDAYAAAGTVIGGLLLENDLLSHTGRFVGVRTTDQARLWTAKRRIAETLSHPIGASFLVTHSEQDNYFAVLDVRTGKAALSGGGFDLSDCHYDAKDTVICHGATATTGYDAATFRKLWSRPRSNLSRPGLTVVTAAWHGAVYGVHEKKPVIIDARTGADVTTAPGAGPYVVNEYGGLGPDEAGTHLVFYPATR